MMHIPVSTQLSVRLSRPCLTSGVHALRSVCVFIGGSLYATKQTSTIKTSNLVGQQPISSYLPRSLDGSFITLSLPPYSIPVHYISSTNTAVATDKLHTYDTFDSKYRERIANKWRIKQYNTEWAYRRG